MEHELWQLVLPAYNGPFVASRLLLFMHLLHFFHIPENELVALYFPKPRSIFIACKTNAIGKPEKNSFKIYKHLVQQYMQHVAHSLRVVFSYGHIIVKLLI